VRASGATSDVDFETVSLRADSGAERWRALLGRPDMPDTAGGLALSPNGARLVVTGTRRFPAGSDFETAGYSASG